MLHGGQPESGGHHIEVHVHRALDNTHCVEDDKTQPHQRLETMMERRLH